MPSKESPVVIEPVGEVISVRFVDRNILEESSIQRFASDISAVVEPSTRPKVLIDFENVEHLSSAALGALITINNRVKAKGGQLRLANIDSKIFEVFVITRLNQLFQIHQDAEQAIASFR
ncbi:MAG: STAS domain-containing protein [Phycisphaeraceae bacterium]|nr:STAS domain-containing protein [Phycisphaeraceae bacterium]